MKTYFFLVVIISSLNLNIAFADDIDDCKHFARQMTAAVVKNIYNEPKEEICKIFQDDNIGFSVEKSEKTCVSILNYTETIRKEYEESMIQGENIVFMSCYVYMKNDNIGPDDPINSSFWGELNKLRSDQVIAKNIEEYNSFEIAAAKKIREIIRIYPEKLVTNDESGLNALLAASFFGYPLLVDEILKDSEAIKHIEYKNKAGITALGQTVFAPKDASWVCNPKILQKKEYMELFEKRNKYTSSIKDSKYIKIRKSLLLAGAQGKEEDFKNAWNVLCKNANPAHTEKILKSEDVLLTILEISKEPLENFINDSD